MKILLGVFFSLVSGQLCCQNLLRGDSLDACLRRIDNNSVRAVNNSFARIAMSKDANLLLDAAGDSLVPKLRVMLDDDNKIIAAHVLLTGLLEPAAKTLYHTTEDLTDSIRISYTYNHFSWVAVFDKISLVTVTRVEPAAKEAIKTYWRSGIN